jgi:hypothetical protein
MTPTACVDSLLDPSPLEFFTLSPSSGLIYLALALLSWTVAEVLMAPVLRPAMGWLWLGDAACFFLFVGWYFRVSRLFDGAWRSYRSAISPMIWATGPMHLMFPIALVASRAGLAGVLAYEIVKAGVILAVLSRIVSVIQRLNGWPRWASLGLVFSPLGVAFAGLCLMVMLGGIGVLALCAGALNS